MHNSRNYEIVKDVKKGMNQASELASINHLQSLQNDELFNKLKQGARIGATMLFQMSQEHNLSSKQLFEDNKATVVIANKKKLKR